MLEPIQWNTQMTRCLGILEQNRLGLSHDEQERLRQFTNLVREWNSVTSLVSQRDLDRLEEIHLPDALSLVPILHKHTEPHDVILDIGTGGGFPAVPVAVALPDRRHTWIERSMKKIGFLRKIQGALSLHHVTIRHGAFPDCVADESFAAITARAVEEPKDILRAVQPFVMNGAVFLCQSGEPDAETTQTFHVEHIVDGWSAAHLRRGSLYLVQARPLE